MNKLEKKIQLLKDKEEEEYLKSEPTFDENGNAYIIAHGNVKVSVCKCHWHKLNRDSWHIDANGYVNRNIGKEESRKLHHVVMKLHGHPDWDVYDYVVDHKNNNKLDNRYENLRIVTYQTNSRNKSKAENATSQYFGVSKHPNENVTKPWRMSMKIGDKVISHHFKTEKEAALSYNYFMIKSFNENERPRLNEIEDLDNSIKDNMLQQIEENESPRKTSLRYVGVYKINDQSYRAYISKDGIRINIGSYDNEVKAAEAYNEKAKEFGYASKYYTSCRY